MKKYPRDTCPIEFAMHEIAGKWKLVLLWHIYRAKIIRYGELKREVPRITHKVLSSQLKELVTTGIINKKNYNQIPLKVEYSLSEKGNKLIPALKELFKWGDEFIKDICFVDN